MNTHRREVLLFAPQAINRKDRCRDKAHQVLRQKKAGTRPAFLFKQAGKPINLSW